jgi:hypothetical protein
MALITFPVIAAFGLVMATVAVLPIVQAAPGQVRIKKPCHGTTSDYPPCNDRLHVKPR